MNREIKFRAWDKEKLTWVDPIDILIEGEGTLCRNESQTNPRKEFIEVMQYTGLNDKNGKEIYEGDVVITSDYPFFDEDKPNYRGTVEWVYSQWQVILHCVNPEKSGISDGINNGLNEGGIEEGMNSLFEVIGNIYENPELLKA